jgi:hypothetical protein
MRGMRIITRSRHKSRQIIHKSRIIISHLLGFEGTASDNNTLSLNHVGSLGLLWFNLVYIRHNQLEATHVMTLLRQESDGRVSLCQNFEEHPVETAYEVGQLAIPLRGKVESRSRIFIFFILDIGVTSFHDSVLFFRVYRPVISWLHRSQAFLCYRPFPICSFCGFVLALRKLSPSTILLCFARAVVL